MDDAAAGALLAVVSADTSAMEGMPAVVNFNFLPRYGQNDCVMALGRKNWLFAGSDDGGERAANIYSLLGTARLNELNPEAYLRYVLERIADHPITEIDKLLPWNVVAQLPQLRLAA
jgi:hypothetical protein